ncbi:SRPBCC domain-containing protein [Actinoplanes sp. CA-131856]
MSGLGVSAPGDRDIVLTRSFAAAPSRVFAAWTQPALLTRWYGARGWHLVECEIDLRVGGAYRFVSEGPGGDRMTQRGTYRVVDPPHRLLHTERFDDQSYPGDTLISHEFRAEGDGTVLTTVVRYATPAGRERALSYPMARGIGEGFERLDTLLYGGSS